MRKPVRWYDGCRADKHGDIKAIDSIHMAVKAGAKGGAEFEGLCSEAVGKSGGEN